MFCWILISLLVRFLKAQEIIYAQIGGTVTIPSDVLGTEDNIYVNWYNGSDANPTISWNPQHPIKKGKDGTTRITLLQDRSLQISPVQPSDFQVWRRVQHVLKSESEKTYKLYHVTIPKVPPVIAGDPVSLDCQLESSSVRPSVTWIPPKNSDCHRNKYYRAEISVQNVSRCHSGVWTCKVAYKEKTSEATTTVSVIDLSPSPPDAVYTSVSPSSKVIIPCSLSSNIPWSVLNGTGLQGGNWRFTPLSDPNQHQTLFNLGIGPVVRWDATLDTDRRFKGRELKDQDLSIHYDPVSEEIRGNYNCSLKFKSKTLSREVKVEVLQVISSEGSRLYEGQGVNLTCTLGHPIDPDLEVKWRHRSRYSDHTSPFLHIPEVTMEHSGQWKCELWKNSTELTSAVLSLKIEKAPVDIWLCVAISGGVVVLILILVSVVICIRRRKQMMMYRRRKTRFCCCKNPQPKGFYKT